MPYTARDVRLGFYNCISQAIIANYNCNSQIILEKQPQFHAAFAGDLSPQMVLDSIEAYAGRILPGKTLLFIDEIQACPRAIMALRYFFEELPDLYVVAAGSMLEFAFAEISVPVGRVQYLHISPMTFYEYLLAMGKDVAAENVLRHPHEHSPAVAGAISEQLRDYFFIGGMPEAEVDYLAVSDGKIYPLEVKSGAAGRLKSMHLCLETYPNCEQGWVLQDGAYNELVRQKLVFWPLYATPLLGNREQLP